MSYEPFYLPQSNQTLHTAAVHKVALDCSVFGGTLQNVFTVPPHMGHMCIEDIWLHGDQCGFSTAGRPLFSLGWFYSSASQYVDVIAASTATPADANRFLDMSVIGSVATPVRPMAPNTPLVARVGTLAGSSTTSANYTQPAVGGTVTIALPSVTWPIVNGTAYIGVIGSAYDVYTITALAPAVAPYTSMTLRLDKSNVIAPGGTIPSGRTVAAAAKYSMFLRVLYRRSRWSELR